MYMYVYQLIKTRILHLSAHKRAVRHTDTRTYTYAYTYTTHALIR